MEKLSPDEAAKQPLVIVVIGMAGSGKTTYMKAITKSLIADGKKVYSINLDPAVYSIPYNSNIDIRDSINYQDVMKHYKLGPNGAIMTSLNLFATKFDGVMDILLKRSTELDYILVDTPGQIEVFNWSASGSIILESLATTFPSVINYVVDTTRSQKPITFMANMIYACSVMYKFQLPFIASFNKIDAVDPSCCIEWMNDYYKFSEAVLASDDSYMGSFSRSCALMLNEFYREIQHCSISSVTGDGMDLHKECLLKSKEEYLMQYLPFLKNKNKESVKVPNSGD
ncbi:GPN-loop GTPase 1 homolog [Babesia microti strain RI]|uniref:GPN-loop GTPase n=1 Tax=Babesia microti (strain RI) TaxID=1133968 RepID=A0A1R4ABG0_BABMR|nr:GPN-loop GTPase 1 homolog [Babesia microti strain RI]SJK86361.1 GPN-loop GTPase 1 homolog [Babesia microti strain RI]|eukprot:XP_021338526.1 GPN-loop GTPase 1 homolog [Babesia microti strain RI]